jgi:hypothetical protein
MNFKTYLLVKTIKNPVMTNLKSTEREEMILWTLMLTAPFCCHIISIFFPIKCITVFFKKSLTLPCNTKPIVFLTNNRSFYKVRHKVTACHTQTILRHQKL